ncbi:MAG: short chain dehydrogenase [Actinobacteria bacterium]|jgi:NAD(P)-dependent dehydrogenase (short-subunit alcohol dehydrogenase family)|nr:short chain dehydrogenase [Actinomycetota bacterium]NCW34632.1 short chain dehydrogenase [Actinomycetota bacterium]NDC12674.1 short chain dehydrogenase [Actinomycetota bacterium]NDC52138.1 short chain dehydrogenase [Actinomycetota bacterium]NDD59865.1 short chain dehydrogenase [Actinomycetota bacterium]
MKILVVGSTGLIGRYVEKALAEHGEVIGVARSTPISVDVNDPQSISAMYQKVGKVDAVASCIGKVAFKSITELTYDDYLRGLTDKAMGQVELVREGINYLHDGGSFTLMTGILGRRPILTGTVASLANGAIEAFTKAASIELPRGIRINTVSPSVLVEATSYHPYFEGFHQVKADDVAKAYVAAVTGAMTGEVFRMD